MAHPAKRLPDNAPGGVFVDSTCIDCGACRWIAPRVFGALDDFAYVQAQPADADQARRAGVAALACPVGAIGGADAKGAREALPEAWGDGVHYLGYHSPRSFGAASWLIVRPGGNVMIDTPRLTRRVVADLERLGGVGTIFLTHRDDVAEHARLAAHFGALRVMHRDDVEAGTAGVERQVTGAEPVPLADGLLLIPAPGHTRGSMCLLYTAGAEGYLFTGDHLALDREGRRLIAFRDACWYDWKVQTAAMERLREHRFSRVLPGHGRPGRLEPAAMRRALEDLIGRMRAR